MSTYHYHVDHLGTPRQVTNSASVIIGRHDYLPFGPELTSTRINESKLQDLKFTGHERDEARDRPPLDYMHARYYEPRLGRFLSVDPGRDWEPRTPQSWNMYSYVRNNPMILTDPSGRKAVPGSSMYGSERCKYVCAENAAKTSEEGRSHVTVTVTAEDPGWFNALLYRVGLKAMVGREFTEAEVAAMMGRNDLATHLMLGGEVNRVYGGVVIVGPFSIRNWQAYPATVPRPTGPFQVLYGEEYAAARTAANNANRALHRADPSLAGKQIHEIQPVKFGGSPTDAANKIPLPPAEHAAVSSWWSRFLRSLND